eukprot:13992308-Alexandrium_andersonii.AAC.1
MSGGPEVPPGLEPEAQPPPKRPRGTTSAPPSSARTSLVPIAEEEASGGAPAGVWRGARGHSRAPT